MPEDFSFMWGDHGAFLGYEGAKEFLGVQGVTQGALDALAAESLLHMRAMADPFETRRCTLRSRSWRPAGARTKSWCRIGASERCRSCFGVMRPGYVARYPAATNGNGVATGPPRR